MAAKIKITLRGSDPEITRTVAVPEGTDLLITSNILVTSMGWLGGRDCVYILEPGTGLERMLTPSEERSMTVDDLRGHKVILIFDKPDYWTLRLEFQKDVESDVPCLLRHKGECPPQILHGVKDWNRINKASSDPDDPYHEQAKAWMMSVMFDPESIDARLRGGNLSKTPRFDEETYTDAERRAGKARADDGERAFDESILNTVFRCPRCGSGCDGRANHLSIPVFVNGRSMHQVIIMCPRCVRPFKLSMFHDGYFHGYAGSEAFGPYDQHLDYYDLLLRKDDEMTVPERAEYLADLGLAEERYRVYEKSPVEPLMDACSSIDPSDPESIRIVTKCLLAAIRKDMGGSEPIVDDAENMIECLRGTYGSQLMSVIGIVNHKGDGTADRYAEQAMDILEEDDSEGRPYDRCDAASLASTCAMIGMNAGVLRRSAKYLDGIVSEFTSHPEDMLSCDWSGLCSLFENLCQYLHTLGCDDETEGVVKSMSGPFADDWDDRYPTAVRNIVRFRRAVVFLTKGGDREQVADDLVSVVDSMDGDGFEGGLTNRRGLISMMMLASMGKMDIDRITNRLVQLVPMIDDDEFLENMMDLYCRTCVSVGMKFREVRKNLGMMGMRIDSENIPLRETDGLIIEDIWEATNILES